MAHFLLWLNRTICGCLFKGMQPLQFCLSLNTHIITFMTCSTNSISITNQLGEFVSTFESWCVAALYCLLSRNFLSLTKKFMFLSSRGQHTFILIHQWFEIIKKIKNSNGLTPKSKCFLLYLHLNTTHRTHTKLINETLVLLMSIMNWTRQF